MLHVPRPTWATAPISCATWKTSPSAAGSATTARWCRNSGNTLRAENILARRYFWPGCHKMEPYRSLFPHAGLLLPATEAVAASVIVLPTGQTMDAQKIAVVGQVIRTALQSV